MNEGSGYRLIQTPHFDRSYRRFAKKHPELKEVARTTFTALQTDPFAPALRLHELQGTLKGRQAVSLTYAYRIVLCVEVTEREVILHDIGTHDEVYG